MFISFAVLVLLIGQRLADLGYLGLQPLVALFYFVDVLLPGIVSLTYFKSAVKVTSLDLVRARLRDFAVITLVFSGESRSLVLIEQSPACYYNAYQYNLN